MSSNKELKRKIIDAADSVRQKFKMLKFGEAEEISTLNKIFNPIAKPLKELKEELIIQHTNNNTSNQTLPVSGTKNEVKVEPEPEIGYKLPVDENEEEELGVIRKSYGRSGNRKTMEFIRNMQQLDDIIKDSDKETPEHNPTTSMPSLSYQKTEEDSITKKYSPGALEEYLSQYPTISRDYICNLLEGKEKVDNIYGPRFDVESNKFSIGNQEMLILHNGNIKVGDHQYPGTKGLYDLIFLKNPKGYTKEEQDYYQHITLFTNIAYKGYNTLNDVERSKHNKWKYIIKPAIHPVTSPTITNIRELRSNSKTRPNPSTSTGHGMNLYNSKPIEYVYWDDINELVSRLGLLHASVMAGNNSHINEIRSIEEELREVGVIY